MPTEQRVVLEQETVSGVWIDDQLGVGQMLRQDNRIYGRDDQVIATARDQDWAPNVSQMRVCRLLVAIPLGQGRSMGVYSFASQIRIALACSRLESIPEGRTCCLARFALRKEELEQSIPGWGQRRCVKNVLIEILGALAFSRTSTRQYQATNTIRALQRQVPRDRATQREAE